MSLLLFETFVSICHSGLRPQRYAGGVIRCVINSIVVTNVTNRLTQTDHGTPCVAVGHYCELMAAMQSETNKR